MELTIEDYIRKMTRTELANLLSYLAGKEYDDSNPFLYKRIGETIKNSEDLQSADDIYEWLGGHAIAEPDKEVQELWKI